MIEVLLASTAVLALATAAADLIAVAGDPFVDPTAVQRVTYVMAQGRPIPMKGQ